MRIALCFIPFVVIACDSPGGGGGGTVNCSLTSNAPICNPDVTTNPDVTNDTSNDTGTSNPDTQIDTIDDTGTLPDTDTVQADTNQPDTTPPPECTGSATRCSGNDGQICNNGFWMTTQTCSGNATCQNGTCVATSSCTNGTRRCTGNNVEQCSSGQWVVAETCSNGCANNQCNAPPSGLACTDVFQCIIDANCFANWPSAPTSGCTSPCLNQGSTLGRTEMNAVLSCYAGCNYDDECILHTCYQQRSNCFFDRTGSLTCEQIDNCIGNCTSSGACVTNCYEQGTNAAQGQYIYIAECLDGYCGDDQSCWGQAISTGQPCAQAFNTCFP